jgi:hypothetical protein
VTERAALKIQAAVLVAFAIAVAIVCGCSESVLYRAEPSDFDAWVESMRREGELETVHAISEWMRANMKYESDGLIDYVKPWRRAWNQTGDCEDFAGVACEALHRLGYTDYRIVSVFHPAGGHAVCSNGRFHLGNWPAAFLGTPGDWPAVAGAIYGDWTSYNVRDLSLAIVASGTRN